MSTSYVVLPGEASKDASASSTSTQESVDAKDYQEAKTERIMTLAEINEKEHAELIKLILSLNHFFLDDDYKKRLIGLEYPLTSYNVRVELESIIGECKEFLARPTTGASKLGCISSIAAAVAGIFCICIGNPLGGPTTVGGIAGLIASDDGENIIMLNLDMMQKAMSKLTQIEKEIMILRTRARHSSLSTPSSVTSSPHFAFIKAPPTPADALHVSPCETNGDLREDRERLRKEIKEALSSQRRFG